MGSIFVLTTCFFLLSGLAASFVWFSLGPIAFWIFVIFLALWIFGALFFSERRMVRGFEPIQGEFHWSGPFHRLLATMNARERVMVIKDPTPLIYCARSLGSRGTLLVTTGLLGTLNEGEWVQSIHEALRFIRRKRHPFVTFLAYLSNRFSSRKPFSSWYGWTYGQGESQPVKSLSPWGLLVLVLWTPYFELCNQGLRWLNSDFKLPIHWPLKIKGIHPVAMGPVPYQGIALR